MSFLLLPVDAPARIIGGHPWPNTISDALGGATPAPLYLPGAGCAAWVRESAATEGLARNPVASVLCVVYGGGRIPILGPAALTTITWTSPGVGAADCLPERAVDAFRAVLDDMRHALDGHDDGFSQPLLAQGEWPRRVRAAGEVLAAVPIPDDWPWCQRGPTDPVADTLRKMGLGQVFLPIQSR